MLTIVINKRVVNNSTKKSSLNDRLFCMNRLRSVLPTSSSKTVIWTNPNTDCGVGFTSTTRYFVRARERKKSKSRDRVQRALSYTIPAAAQPWHERLEDSTFGEFFLLILRIFSQLAYNYFRKNCRIFL